VWVHVPGTGIPAIDAAGTHRDGTDLRGMARPQGVACHMGAVEARRYDLQRRRRQQYARWCRRDERTRRTST